MAASPTPLDAARIRNATFVRTVEHHSQIGSTNDRARQLQHKPGMELPLLVVADHQTAGRGRGQHTWWTGHGSLAASLLLDPAAHGVRPELQPRVSLAAAVATIDTVAPLLPHYRLGLHWPNDVFVEGDKLAGVLVEAPSPERIIVGLGVNTNSTIREAPYELRRAATTLLDLTGQWHDRDEFLVALLNHFAAALGQLAHEPARVGRRFNELCLQRGQTLTVRSGSATYTGRCLGIALDGSLLLETPHGTQAIYSGFLVRE
jgi:BirA family biotin operon repressor/biotin-[acetyl-CoA-carboxylase] ligase